MSSNASEARRLRSDRRKRSKDYDISKHKYTCWDEQALHVDTNVAIVYSMDALTSASDDSYVPINIIRTSSLSASSVLRYLVR
jgi:hypothetical protein